MRLPARFSRRTLMGRLVWSFLLPSVLMVAAVGTISFLRARDSLESSVYDRLGAVADAKSEALDRWIDEQQRSLVFIGTLPQVGRAANTMLTRNTSSRDRERAHDQLAEALTNTVRQTSEAQEYLVLDLRGRVRLATVREHEGASLGDEEFFQQGASGTTVQNPYVSSLTSQPTITVATPLFVNAGTGRRAGVLAANLDLSRIDRIILGRTGLGESGATYLVGRDRRFVHEILNAPRGGRGVRSAGIDAALAGRSGTGLYDDFRGTPVVGLYRWLENREAAMIVEMSQDEAFAPARRLAVSTGGIGLGIVALLAIGIYLAARRIARPILAITDAATAGDLTRDAPVTSRDEIGTLARAFNEMTSRLHETLEGLEERVAQRTEELSVQHARVAQRTEELRVQHAELSALHEATVAVMQRLDIEDLLRELLADAAALFDTPHGYIYLRRPEEDAIRSTVALGVFEEELGTRLGRGEGLVGRVWQAREPVIVEDYDAWEGRDANFPRGRVRALVGVPLQSAEEVVGALGVARDASDGRSFSTAEVRRLERFAQIASIALDNARLYAEAQEARAAADSANAGKSVFLASMSHEIRTPLNVVIGMSDLLMRSDLDEEERDYASTIRSSSQALLTVINDILDFSKLEAGRMELESVPFDLHECVEGALSLMRVVSADKGLELASEIRPGTPRTIVGDGPRLRQILLNLLNNAVKFTEAGRVRITVEAGPPADDGRFEVRIAVSDTGLGISPEQMERLFRPFSQADPSITRRYGGTGLGLAISQRLVEAMGGTMWAESSGVPGEGTTFHVSIATEAAAPVPVPAAAPGAGLELEPGHAERYPRRILLVEDAAVNQKLALRLLARMGYAADLAANGREAVQAVERRDYDLVLMDVQMPEMDGLEATREIIARTPADRRPWIVAMTANAFPEDRERCFEAGMNAYIAKPIQVHELVAAIRDTPVATEDA